MAAIEIIHTWDDGTYALNVDRLAGDILANYGWRNDLHEGRWHVPNSRYRPADAVVIAVMADAIRNVTGRPVAVDIDNEPPARTADRARVTDSVVVALVPGPAPAHVPSQDVIETCPMTGRRILPTIAGEEVTCPVCGFVFAADIFVPTHKVRDGVLSAG